MFLRLAAALQSPRCLKACVIVFRRHHGTAMVVAFEFMSHSWGGVRSIRERSFCCRRRREKQDQVYQAEADLAQGREIIRRYDLLIALFKEVLAEGAVHNNVSRIVQGVKEVVGCEQVSLFMREEGRGLVCLASKSHQVGAIVKPGVGLVGLVADTGMSINIPDARVDPSFIATGGASMHPTARSVVCVALKGRSGEVVAIVEAVNKRCNTICGAGDCCATMLAVTPTEPAPVEPCAPFDETDEKMLKVILSLVSEQLRVLALTETQERSTRQVESLLTMVGGMSAALREGSMLLDDVADAMLDQLNCGRVFLFLVESSSLVIRARSPHNPAEKEEEGTSRRRTMSFVSPVSGVLGSVVNTGEPLLLGSDEKEQLEELQDVLPDHTGCPISALLCPLVLRDGSVFGVVVALNKVLSFDEGAQGTEEGPTLHRKINKVLKKQHSSHSNDSRAARLCTRSVATSFSSIDVTRMRALSSFVTHCVLTAEVYEKQKVSNRTLSALLKFCTETVRATNRGALEDMVRAICIQGRLIFNCEYCRFYVVDALSDGLFCWYLDDMEDDTSALTKTRVRKAGIVGTCVTDHMSMNVSNVVDHPSFNQNTDMVNGDFAESIMCQPIKAQNGRAVAALQCVNKCDGKEFDAEDDTTFGIISDLVSDVLLNMAANASVDLLMERNDVHQDVKETMQMFTAHDKKRTGSAAVADPALPKKGKKKLGVAQYLSVQSVGGALAIEDLLTWDLDYGAYAEHNSVQGIAVALDFYNLLRTFKLSTAALNDTLIQIECRYKANPYHNWCHAFCTFHVLFLVLSELIPMLQMSVCSVEFHKLDQLAVLLAALAHDVGHRGRNNGFEIETRSDLAITYNDRSPLENHHAAVACSLFFKQPDAVMGILTREESKRARATMIESILHTDMCDHQKNLLWLQSHTLFSVKAPAAAEAESGGGGASTGGEDPSKALCCALLHAADLGHPCLPWASHKRFSLMACQEFYDQFQEESRLGLPTMPFMSKDPQGPLNDLAPSQAGFVNFVVAPLWTALSSFTQQKLHFIVDNVMCSKGRWDSIANGEAEEDAFSST